MAKAKVLMVSVNPTNTERLMLDEEVRSIEQRLYLSTYRDSIELIPKGAARPQDLMEHLNRYRPQVLHFSGHGNEEEIVFTNDLGMAQPVSKQALAGIFKTLKDDIRVVVLNACFSEAQAQAITQHIDCAIGMSREIGDQAAIIFAAAFYSALGYGRPVGQAFEQGTLALMLEGVPEYETPRLLSRSGIDPENLYLFANHSIPPKNNISQRSRGSKTALIVEDDISILALLASLLKREGFVVSKAATAREANEILHTNYPDLVILDMELPDGNGLELARAIRKERETGIIFLTQRTDPTDKIAGLDVGGDDYMTKPFDPEELIARIGSVLRRTKGARISS